MYPVLQYDIFTSGGLAVRKGILCAALAALVFSAFPVGAQAAGLPDLLPDMLATHERVQAATQAQDAAAFRQRQAESGWYPKLDLVGDFSQEFYDTNKQALRNNYRNIQKLRGTQLLYDFGKTDSVIAQMGATAEQAEQRKVLIRQALLLEGVTSYVNLLKHVRTLGYAMQSVESFKKQSGIEEVLVEKGAGLSSDVLQAKYKLSGALGTQVAVEGQLANAKSRFLAVYGFEVSDADVLDFEPPLVPYERIPASLDEAIEIARTENPELLMAQKSVQMAEAALDSANAKFYPSFNAFWEYWRKENDAGQKDTVQLEQRFGVEYTYNLLNGGGDMQAVEAAVRDRDSGVNSLKDMERTIEERIRTAWQNLLTARARAEWFRSQASILEGFLELARKERTLGNRSLLDVLAAETDFYNAQIQLVGAEYDQMIEAYNLLYAMGRLELDLFL